MFMNVEERVRFYIVGSKFFFKSRQLRSDIHWFVYYIILEHKFQNQSLKNSIVYLSGKTVVIMTMIAIIKGAGEKCPVMLRLIQMCLTS